MLSYQNVTKEFQLDEEVTITPVRNVSLTVARGEFIIIIGRSGSGKTTLLNLAAGLVKPTSGKVLIENLNLGGMTDKQLSDMRSRRIGFVFQFPSLLPALTVLENVTLPSVFASGNGKKDARDRAANLIKVMGLEAKMDVFPRQLSAGEQKRVVIARALINRPQMILADEPTSDLDEQTENEVMGLLRDINYTGVTFLMVTHSLQLIPYASRAFKMENGTLSDIIAGKGKPIPRTPDSISRLYS
jgi:putative ABC transport system ATP-binding protein